MMKNKFILAALIILLLLVASFIVYKKLFILNSSVSNMEIASSDFYNNNEIPRRYTCEGEEVNPYFKISEIPKETKTLVLIMDDPDAKKVVGKTWVHWLVFNISVKSSELEIQEDSVPGMQGTNDFKKLEYGGPCPPAGSGVHHYYFKVYALDSELDLKEGAVKTQIEKAMKNKIIEKAELIGTFEKKGK